MRLVVLLLFLVAGPAAAAPAAEPWPLWERHDESSRQVVDQAPWARFLRTYLTPGAGGVARVAYARVTPADRQALEADLVRLAASPVSTFTRAEQRAYWTNLYNQLTIVVVLRHMPTPSITSINLSPGLFSSGPWDAKLIQVEGTKLSLNDIEHRILRPIWRDPRTHYTVNCASIGCPNLAGEPYTAANMAAALDRGARDYVNSPRGASVQAGRLTASKIYDWYQSDFGGSERGVIAHLKQYAGPELARSLEGVSTVRAYEYDWALNAP